MRTSNIVCFLFGVCVGACVALAGIRLGRDSSPTPSEGVPVEVVNELPSVDEPVLPKFFVRYIDTLTNDTLYYVCYRDANGDSIPDRVPVIYANGDTLYYNYYLNSNGDTVLLDYTDPTAALLDSLRQEEAMRMELDRESMELVDEVSRYLDGLGQ